MKANGFVKKVGWGKAKEVSSFTSNVCEDPTHFDSDLDIYVHFDDFKGVMDESDVCIHDLKRLVESWELANRLGGVDTLRIMIEQMEINDLCDGMNISFDGEWQGVFTKSQLQQAIADVESCL